ncbi:MAG: T9SS type A sorting domain-containing protein [Crocinitomicaceae bacterium]|nr:MAG: T9SS type A sorting domain-containing protein [Crocinitomicaceae bacterium]
MFIFVSTFKLHSMKLLLLILPFISLFALSQGDVFSRDYDYYLASSTSKHNYFANGDRISVFSTVTNDINFNEINLITILRKNATTGQTSQFDLVLEDFHSSIIYGIITYSDNSYLIAIQDFANDVNQILLKFSANNSLLWKERIFVSTITSTYKDNEILDNGQGGAYLMISDGESSGIININENGQIQWAKSIVGENSSGKSPGFSICKNASGGVNGTLKDESYQCVFSLDNNGNEIWSKSHVDMQYRWPVRIQQTNDSGFIVGGTFYDFLNNQHYPYINKYSSNGTVQFAKKINLLSSELCDIQQDSNGEYYILISYGNNIIISKINEQGIVTDSRIENSNVEILNSRFINQPNNLEFNVFINGDVTFNQAIVNFDGDLSSLCYFESYPNVTTSNDSEFLNAIVNTGVNINTITPQIFNDITVAFPSISLIYSADYCSFLGTPETLLDETISIYPNPTSNNLTIDLDGQIFNDIRLHELNGKFVKSICVECSGQITESLESIDKGVYFLHFNKEDALITKKIVIN